MLSKHLFPLFLSFGQKFRSTLHSCRNCHPYHTQPILTSELISRESLYESDDLPIEARHSAALLASKVYYFLGEYDEALSFALGAGSAFQAEARAHGTGEYVETVICKHQIGRSSL